MARRTAAAAASPLAAPVVHDNKSSRSVVTVACKVPLSSIELQLCQGYEKQENTQTGPRTVKEFRKIGAVHRIRGTAYPNGTVPKGFPKAPEDTSGFVLTHGIPLDFWQAWLQQNQKSDMVRNGMIYAFEMGKEDHIEGTAEERRSQLSGLEPIDPEKDPRAPRSTKVEVTNAEQEEGQSGRRRTGHESHATA